MQTQTKKQLLVYVDETGDRGSGTKASPFFSMVAIVLPTDDLPALQQVKNDINAKLEKPIATELHWSKNLKRHEQRLEAIEHVAKLNLRIVNVTVDKTAIPPKSLIAGDRDALYNYSLRLLLERVSWLSDANNGLAQVTLASVKGLPRRVIDSYVEKLRIQQNAVNWEALHPSIRVKQANARDGLQIADLAAGALDRAIRRCPNPPHRIEPAYLLKVAHLVYTRGPDRVHSYGMKSLNGLFASFPWWSEINSMPDNELF
jgi:hypothetical protein